MSYTLKDMDREIDDRVGKALEAGPGPAKFELVDLLLKAHKDLEGVDVDFALCAMAYTITARVEKYFQRMKASPEERGQWTLPGCKRLQDRYLVTRDVTRPVLLDDMTAEEIRAKADEHLGMARGHEEHAKELLEYLRQREMNE